MGYVVPFARPSDERHSATCRCGKFTLTGSIVGTMMSAGAPCCGDTVTLGGSGSFVHPMLNLDFSTSTTTRPDDGPTSPPG